MRTKEEILKEEWVKLDELVNVALIETRAKKIKKIWQRIKI